MNMNQGGMKQRPIRQAKNNPGLLLAQKKALAMAKTPTQDKDGSWLERDGLNGILGKKLLRQSEVALQQNPNSNY